MTLEEHNNILATLLKDNLSHTEIGDVVNKLQLDYRATLSQIDAITSERDKAVEESNTYAKQNNALYMQILGQQTSTPSTPEPTNEPEKPPKKLEYSDLKF